MSDSLNEQTGQFEGFECAADTCNKRRAAADTQDNSSDTQTAETKPCSRKHFPTLNDDTCPVDPELKVCLLVSILITTDAMTDYSVV